MSLHILGTGSYLPPAVVTNDDMAKLVDTNDEWISTRTGIRSRHVSTDEPASTLAAKAAQAALENSGVRAEELDLILCATVSGEFIVPSMACLVQREIGATCPGFDLNGACSAFLFLMETAAAYLSTGRYQKILIVGTEQMSRILDWTDRSTCILFGDGAGAAVLEPGEDYLGSHMTVKGGEEVLRVPTHKGISPFWTAGEEHPYVFMNGSETYKFATRSIPQEVEALLAQCGVEQSQVDWVICHQANRRIIEAAARRLKGIPAEKFLMNIDHCGNCSAASVPILLDECNRKGIFHRGDLILMCAFGGGLSSTACLVRW
ncbi:MAG: ketoacyl-ACP synthase III [Clostridiales bacterium]|nr:ketoacyl-ACP synthase III [Clostridiales bacterium]